MPLLANALPTALHLPVPPLLTHPALQADHKGLSLHSHLASMMLLTVGAHGRYLKIKNGVIIGSDIYMHEVNEKQFGTHF